MDGKNKYMDCNDAAKEKKKEECWAGRIGSHGQRMGPCVTFSEMSNSRELHGLWCGLVSG